MKQLQVINFNDPKEVRRLRKQWKKKIEKIGAEVYNNSFKKRSLNQQREKEAKEELKEAYEDIGRIKNTNQK